MDKKRINIGESGIDQVFRDGLDHFEVEPSDSFWSRSESFITNQENARIRKRLVKWQVIAGATFVLAVATTSFILYTGMLSEPAPKQDMAINYPAEPKVLSMPEAGLTPEVQLPTVDTDQKQMGGLVSKIILNHPQPKMADLQEHLNLPNKVSVNKNRSKEEIVENESINESEVLAEAIQPYSRVYSEKQEETAEVQPLIGVDNDSATTSESIVNEMPFEIVQEEVAEKPLDGDQQVRVTSRWYVSGKFSPLLSGVLRSDNKQNVDFSEDDLGDDGEDNIGYQAGAQVGYEITDKWSLQTGLFFKTSTLSLLPKTLYAQPGLGGEPVYSLVTSLGTVHIAADASTPIGDSLIVLSNSNQKLGFIVIPFELKYVMLSKRLEIYSFAGATVNYLIKSATQVHLDDEEFEDGSRSESFKTIEGVRKMHIGYNFGLGVSIKVSKHLGVLTEPSYSGSFSSINKNSPFQSRLHAWGLALGAIYHF